MTTINKLSMAALGGVIFAIGTGNLSAQAATITFESDMKIPGFEPKNGLKISNQFASDFGITFGLDTNRDGFADAGEFPKLEKATSTRTSGFRGYDDILDKAAPGFEDQLGDFFLKMPKGNKTSLIITYSDPVSGMSGEIWDIDGDKKGKEFEQWRVEALGEDYILGLNSNNIIDSVISPAGLYKTNPDSLNAKPWTWFLDSDAGDEIYAIRISPVGTEPTHRFALDNFTPLRSPKPPEPTPVPEPSSILGLLALGSCAFTARLLKCKQPRKKQ